MPERFRRRPVPLKRRIRGGGGRRIIVPQAEDRQIRLHRRDLVRREFVREDPWWFTLHRRGPKRTDVGEDPLEARAVSKEQIHGTLPERIMYLALIRVMHFSPEQDFDFQSSLEGGRLELGGIVADFLFPYLHIIINPLGPTHDHFLQSQKDKEQRGILEEMGYTYWEVEDDIVYNEFLLEDWLRRHFNLASGRGGGGISGSGPEHSGDQDEGIDPYLLELVYAQVQMAEQKLDDLFTSLPALLS